MSLGFGVGALVRGGRGVGGVDWKGMNEGTWLGVLSQRYAGRAREWETRG